MERIIRTLRKKFKYGEKGFTLIELLVVIAILGVLAAIAIPNVAKFIGSGRSQAAATELSNVQTAVTAAMAAAQTGSVLSPGTFSSASDVIVGVTNSTTYTVGAYISGGKDKVAGTYDVASDGSVSQTAYPGL